MEPYVAFSNDAILEGATPQETSPEGQTWVPIPVETQAAPTEEPTKELAPAEVSTKEATPTEDPTKELALAEISMEEATPQKSPPKRWPLQWHLQRRQPLWRSPMRNQPLLWPWPEGRLKS